VRHKVRVEWISKQPAECCYLLRINVCLLKIHQCHTSHSPHIMSMQDRNTRKSRNFIVGRAMSYVISPRPVENLMLSSLYIIFWGRSCSTPTNHSNGPPLFLEYFAYVICLFFLIFENSELLTSWRRKSQSSS